MFYDIKQERKTTWLNKYCSNKCVVPNKKSFYQLRKKKASVSCLMGPWRRLGIFRKRNSVSWFSFSTGRLKRYSDKLTNLVVKPPYIENLYYQFMML